MRDRSGRQQIAANRKARHNYAILDTYEAGIVLAGTEVKALREGKASLVDGFAVIENDEVWMYGVHISEYSQGTWTNHSARRKRKLLLHRRQITKISLALQDHGSSLIPLSLYSLDGLAKIELALARGKTAYDKRQTLAARDANREIERAMSDHLKKRKRLERQPR